MSYTITHAKVTTGTTDDSVEVDLADWNDSHTITGSVAASEITSGAALTKVDDTNVTLTLGGTPTTALLAATSVTVGWTSTLAVARGGTGSATAADARTALGLAIGTDVQAYDAELAALAGLTSAADKVPYFTGSGTASLGDFTAAGRSMVAAANAAAQTALLSSVVGDSGAGGTKGLVPAPAAGDAAALKFLKADGTWAAAGGGSSTLPFALAIIGF